MSADPPARGSGWTPRPFTIVLATLGAVALAVLLLAALVLSGSSGYRDDAKVEAVAAGDRPVEFTLTDPQELEGTNFIRIAVAGGGHDENSGSYSAGRSDIRNIILIDKATGASRRLLPDNSRRIRNSRFLPAATSLLATDAAAASAPAPQGPPTTSPPPAYILLDLERSEGELLDIVVGTLADTRVEMVMSGVEGVDSVWMQSPSRIGFLVRERRGLYYRIVDVPARKVVLSRKIEVA